MMHTSSTYAGAVLGVWQSGARGMKTVATAASMILLLLSSVGLAQAPAGRAAAYTCAAQESCSDTGSCATLPGTMVVIETFETGTEVGPTYFAGPLAPGARAGLFFEQPLYPLHGATTPEAWFARLPAILGSHLHARVPDDGANRYIVIQPGDEVADLTGTRIVTEYLCTQELFP